MVSLFFFFFIIIVESITIGNHVFQVGRNQPYDSVRCDYFAHDSVTCNKFYIIYHLSVTMCGSGNQGR